MNAIYIVVPIVIVIRKRVLKVKAFDNNVLLTKKNVKQSSENCLVK